jgi:hypothetical protein
MKRSIVARVARSLFGSPKDPAPTEYTRLNCLDGLVDYGPLLGRAPIPFPPKPAPLKFPEIDPSLLPTKEEA